MRIGSIPILCFVLSLAGAVNGQVIVLKPGEDARPEKVLPYESPIELPADGTTRKTVHLEIQDEWGFRLEDPRLATVKITAGRIVNTDMDPLTEGAQLPVQRGMLAVTIQAAQQVTKAILEIRVGERFFQYPVDFAPMEKPFVLVGSLNASLGNTQTSNRKHSDLSDPDDRRTYLADRNLFYGGRNAFYARGNLPNRVRLTASFDSDRYHHDRLFRDIDPDYQYPIYGDASTLVYDAQTESMFYAKLERDQSYVIVGDFNTRLNATEFAAYDRSFNGILTHVAGSNNHSLVGFGTLTDREMTLDDIRGEGISGYYELSADDITVFSEKVKLEIRDRYHPETVIKTTEMVRYRDYDVDYVAGTLLFKQPVPSMDLLRNPVFIVVSYEHRKKSRQSVSGGIRYSGRLLDRFQLGSTFILEEQSPGNYLLYGMDSRLPITDWLTVKGEIARSRDIVSSRGSEFGGAYKTELKVAPNKHVNITGYYRNVDGGFVNRSQTGREFELGSEKYGATGVFKKSEDGQISSEYYRQFNRQGQPNENRIGSFRVMYDKEFREKGKLRFGYEDSKKERKIRNSSKFKTTHSELVRGHLSYRILPKLSAALESDINLDRDYQSKPNSVSVGVSYNISEQVSTYLKYRFISTEGEKSHTVFGFDSRVDENTQLTGKYEIGGSVAEERNRASIGLRNRWQVRDDLTLNLAYENTSTVDSLEIRTRKHESMSMALEYLPELPWKITGKYESGKDRNSNTRVVVLGSDFKIYHGLNSITKLEYFDDDFFEQGEGRVLRTDVQVGVAFRPDFHDYFNAIGKLQYVSDNNSHVSPAIRYDRFIAAILGYVQPLDWLEIGSKIARRWVLDRERGTFEDRSNADFTSLRFEVDWALKWSSVIDLRYLRLIPSASKGEKKTGLAMELNYLLIKNTQVGLGYAFKRYRDVDFAARSFDFGHHDFYITIHAKFSEDILDWSLPEMGRFGKTN